MSASQRRAGIDVGGTKLLGVVLGAEGEVVAEQRRPTPRGGQAELIEHLVALARALEPWDSLGVGLPGLVTRAGVLVAAPNLVEVRDLEVGPLLAGALGTTVEIDNDATCALVGEWRVGVARGAGDVLAVTLGTGIGGAVVAGGRLQRGANGFAGEVGHMVVDPHGPACPCGRSGCWERYASGSGLARLARTALDAGGLDAVRVAAGGDPAAVRGEHVQSAARAGDPAARAVVDEFGRWVALGLANLVNVLDPELVVIGGGLAAAPDVFADPIASWLERLLFSAGARPVPRVAFATLGAAAGAIGAGLLPAEHAR